MVQQLQSMRQTEDRNSSLKLTASYAKFAPENRPWQKEIESSSHQFSVVFAGSFR